MANSIWDVVYGEDRFKGLLGQEGVQATGGGTVYDPTTDYKETRYDNQGNSYLSNPDAPLIPGHTRAGDTPMFESTKVELPPVQSPHDYGSNYYSDEPWTPKVTRPNVQSATIDSLLAQQGVNQVTQQEQEQFNRINASQNRETRYDDQGNPYQVRRDLPLIPGHTRSLEPQSVEPKVDPMSLYNRQGRADYTPQNIVSDDVVMGKPPLGYYPNASERAEAEERWYQNQDKIEAQIQELLKGTALEQQSLEAEEDKLLQQFQQDDFNQRVQDRLSQPTPDWLGQSQGALTDAQREDLNRYTDTDSFGNPLDTDAFGNTNYETNLNRQLDKLNRPFYDEFYGADTQEQAPTPQQASNTTDFFRDRAQASKQYQDAILNIGDTIGEGVSSLYEGAKDLYQDFTKPENKPQIAPTSADDIDVFEVLGETDQLTKPKTEPTFSDDWIGRNQKTTYQTRQFLSDALDVGGEVVDKILPMLNDTTLGILLNPQHKHHQDVKDTARNLTAGLAQGLIHDLPQGTIDFAVDTINTVSNRLGKGDVADTDYWGNWWDAGYTPEEIKAQGYDESTAFSIGRPLAQLGGGYVGLRNLFKTGDTANKALKWFKEGLSVALPAGTLDPNEGNISDFVQSTEFANAFTEFMSAKPEELKTAEDRFVARLKTMGEDLGLAFTAPALYGIVKSPAIREMAKDLTDPKTWGESIEKTTDSLLDMATGGTIKDGGRKELFAGTKGAEALGKTDSLNRAEKLEKEGASKEDIWKYTGFIRGQDGNWRFELDDSQLRIKDSFRKKIEENGVDTSSIGATWSSKLDEVIDYPELFIAYPELKNLNFTLDSRLKPGAGEFVWGAQKYVDGTPSLSLSKINVSPESDLRNIGTHEIQHAIQTLEGHARGSSAGRETFYMLQENKKYQSLQKKKADLEAQAKPLRDYVKKTKGQPYTDERGARVSELNKIRGDLEGINNEIYDIEKSVTSVHGQNQAWKNYRNTAGEAEAREAQKRLNLSNSERHSLIPRWAGVSDKDAILRFDESFVQNSLPWNMSTKGEGDFYITRVGSNAGKVSKTRQSPNDIAFSTDQDVLLPDYAYYAVMNLEKQLKARAHGTAQQSINKKDIDAVLTDFFQNMNKAESVDDGVLGQVGKDYKGTHTAPISEGKNSLDDFSEIFPDNANDPNFARYYGMGGEYAKADAETIAVMKAVQGNPDAEVTIYRAVPKGTKDINAGDWVSTSKDYTKKHGERYIDGDYDIIEKKVRAGDLHTDGDLHEWGYNPSRTDDGVLGQVDTPIDPKTRLELNKQKAESKKRAERLKKQQEIGKAQSEVDEAGFFSRAEQSILDLKQDKNKPNDVLRYLNKQGVTKNEIEDVGLLDYLEKAQETNESVTKKGLLDIVQKKKPRQSETVLKGGSEDIFESIDPDYDYWDIDEGIFKDDFVDARVDSFDYELTSDPSGFDYYDELLDGLSDLNPKKYPQENSRTTWGKKLFDDLDNEKGLDPILERDIDVVLRNIAKEEYLDAPYRKTEIDIGGEKINLYYNEGEGTFYARHEDLPDWEDELIAKDKEITSLSEAVVKLRERFGDYSKGETMHSAQVQPGADLSTYEEVYITSDMVRKHGGFSHEGHHGDIEDVILHMRTSVRTDNEGKKVLFIEELQSDLHQKGRQKGVGYRDSDYKTQLLKNKIAKGDLDDEYDALVKEMDEAGYKASTTSDGTYLQKHGGGTIAKIDGGLTNPTPQYLVDPTTLPESEFKKLDSWFGKYKKFNKRLKDNASERDAILNKVPKAPFRDDAWIQAGLEKAIQMAKSKGVDRVAWTTPEQQVAVWSDKYEKLYQTVYGDKLPGVAKRIANKYGTNTGKTEIEFYGDESFVPNNTTNVDYIDINHTLGEGDYGKGIPLSAVGVGAPTGGLLSMGESEETQADETEGLLKLNKTADKPMKGVLDGVADSKVQRGKNWDNLSSKIRNYVNVKTNNPGNLTFSKNPIDWDGGVDEHYETDKDKYYQFTTPEYGIRALTRDITNKRDKKGLDTIAKIIPVYSPKKSGNDPENYIRIVSQRTGIDRDAKLTDDDMMKIVKGITHMEGAGSLAYYTDDIVIKGIKMAYRNRYQNIND